MIKVDCPICGDKTEYKIIYKENLSHDVADFSARKIPDGYHYQMVRCDGCGLLFADSIYDLEKINEIYQQSECRSSDELDNINKTYSHYLEKLENLNVKKKNFLEIGCDSGSLLERALEIGYKNVVGIEPSDQAIAQASPRIKDKIIHGSFEPGHFKENSFDVIFFAMVIEHMVDASSFVSEIYRILKPGGMVLGITHDENSFLSKLLKEKSPIINDAHICVFSRESLKKIFKKHNFIIEETDSVANIYSFKQWFRMVPMPKAIKSNILKFLSLVRLDDKKLKLKAGNIFITARKPEISVSHQLENDYNFENQIKQYENIAKDLRKMIIDISYRSKAHHIGSALSCIDLLAGLYFHGMKINPQNPKDPNRDWFILSKGHAGLAQYVTLAKRGFFPVEVLDNFLVDGSLLGAHPDKDCVPGVEVSTGSLGHGLSLACGVALAAKKDNIHRRAFVILGDGECDEGSIWETAMFASHHKLDNLTVIVDYNKLQAFGKTNQVLNLDSLSSKFESFGWKALEINGHNMSEIIKALDKLPFEVDRPSVIIANTIKGKGAALMEDKLESHYIDIDQNQRDEIIKGLEL